MNLYIRYFAHEAFVKSVEEAADFLRTIPEIKVEQSLINRINAFYIGSSIYPYHLKVSFNNYVIIIKSDAQSMEEFKEQQKKREEQKNDPKHPGVMTERRRTIQDILNEPRYGWYEASLTFKRVVLIPETSKFQYKDTLFRVRVKAQSAMDCYNRIVDHLRNRQDVDSRSQFPSSKSSNFYYTYLGESLDNINESMHTSPTEEPEDDTDLKDLIPEEKRTFSEPGLFD